MAKPVMFSSVHVHDDAFCLLTSLSWLFKATRSSGCQPWDQQFFLPLYCSLKASENKLCRGLEHMGFAIEILLSVRSKESKLRHMFLGSAVSFHWQGECLSNVTWFIHLINVNSIVNIIEHKINISFSQCRSMKSKKANVDWGKEDQCYVKDLSLLWLRCISN